MEIREIDPHDRALVRRHWEIGRAAEDAYRLVDMFWPWESAWAMLTTASASSKTVLLGAFDGDEMCGAALIGLPLLDNTHRAGVELYVDPPRQRRGVGRALLEAVGDVSRRDDRRTLGRAPAHGSAGSRRACTSRSRGGSPWPSRRT